MKKNIASTWTFKNGSGEFSLHDPQETSGLYFPLANEAGMMCSISPLLGGDIKTGQNTFLMPPVSVSDLNGPNASRNFWLYFDNGSVWSAAGNSAEQQSKRFVKGEAEGEKVVLEAGFLWHRIRREDPDRSISAEITNFVPAGKDQVELMKVVIENRGTETLLFVPTAAVPIYGRSADNIRDHRHVTSLLHTIQTMDYGIVVKPTLSFDERGHRVNHVCYGVFGAEGLGTAPLGFFPVEEDFIGEGGTLQWPEAVVKNLTPSAAAGERMDGFEASGAIRFEKTELAPGEKKAYIIMMAVDEKGDMLESIVQKYGTEALFDYELKKNEQFWSEKLSTLSFHSADEGFDSWLRWVELQPILRRIYGCSFLPHHDYGRGGRGWRDLWQDCLALLILEPGEVRELLLNNYGGVRFDGSNATIIGSKPGEFIADRNNIPRTWMDHGAWPYFTTRLYVDQSGDLEFLLEQQTYFKDKQCCRSRASDDCWDDGYGNKQKSAKGEVYSGTILEHILLEQITAFYNVGEHNNMRLEGADWNDAFDMASKGGESVTFTAFYGSNLLDLSELLLSIKERCGITSVSLAREILLLLDTISEKVDYHSVEQKNALLQKYFNTCIHDISGEKVAVDITELAADLRQKGEWIFEHIRKNEWIKNAEGYEWFNGYYDNDGKALEGDFSSGVRMTLTGQVFPIMGGAADCGQVQSIVKTVNHYLKDSKVGGVRLNSDFKEVKLNMGRGFGFAFGHKENGAMFSHMAVMYIKALYKRGFALEGYELLKGIFEHCSNFEQSRMYPGIPEYINERGRGLYSYLTGAASWLMLTMLGEVYGVKGHLGDLAFEPKLAAEQFKVGKAGVYTVFRGKKLNISYFNEKGKSCGEYRIDCILLDGAELPIAKGQQMAKLDRAVIDRLDQGTVHEIEVILA